MRARAVLIAVGVVVLCVAAAGVGLARVARTPAGQVSPLRGWMLQRSARAQACAGYLQTVPGSYQADPARSVGGYAVVTYSAECTQRGGQLVWVDGWVAEFRRGFCSGRTGGSTGHAPAPGATEFQAVGSEICATDVASGGLRVIHGRVTGAAAATIEAVFSDGSTAPAGLSNGHFSLVAAGIITPCTVRALDSGGNLLAVHDLSGEPAPPSGGICP